ncbi:hypothetical protein [Pseudoxanthomonas putridarboris]|uniref:Uncharacterized protein n=1 Tax=Pseudoxanthomonas putridarboris TaxID=752605 RepID=A0ABU9J3C2_9GAMM
MNVLKAGMAVMVITVAVLALREYVPKQAVQAVVDKVSGNAAPAARGDSRHGFVDIPLPDGQSGYHVVIFAPPNCPSEAARRADLLAQYLDREGIPYARASSADFSTLRSQEEANRVMAVMNGSIPVVFVRHRARANPSPDDVVAEYRAGGSS